MRRMVRAVFAYLRDLGWKKEIREEYWSILKESLITESEMVYASFKLNESLQTRTSPNLWNSTSLLSFSTNWTWQVDIFFSCK